MLTMLGVQHAQGLNLAVVCRTSLFVAEMRFWAEGHI